MNSYDSLMMKQTKIGRFGRAQVIDHLFQIAQEVNIDDKNLVYQATSLMDRYYEHGVTFPKSYSDCYLTGFTAFLIAVKNSEFHHNLRLSGVKNRYLGNNYSREQILQKEFDIRKASGYENEVSTIFDFLLFYVKMWKLGCQKILKDKNLWLTSTYIFICEIE